MVLANPERLRAVWQQNAIPVVWREDRKAKGIALKLPFDNGNRNWLSALGRRYPVWSVEGQYWELPKAWFNPLVERTLERFERLYVIQPYREQEKCSPACLNAKGHDCECSCMGANHGAGNDGGWFEVSETFATRWKERELACRLMTLSGAKRH